MRSSLWIRPPVISVSLVQGTQLRQKSPGRIARLGRRQDGGDEGDASHAAGNDLGAVAPVYASQGEDRYLEHLGHRAELLQADRVAVGCLGRGVVDRSEGDEIGPHLL